VDHPIHVDLAHARDCRRVVAVQRRRYRYTGIVYKDADRPQLEGLREDKPADVRRAVPYPKPAGPKRAASRAKRSRPG